MCLLLRGNRVTEPMPLGAAYGLTSTVRTTRLGSEASALCSGLTLSAMSTRCRTTTRFPFDFARLHADCGTTSRIHHVSTAARLHAKLARAGDVLFSVRAPVGALNLADQEFGIGRGLCAIRPQQPWDAHFAWWALHEACHQLNHVSTGSTYDAVAAEDVGNLLVETTSPGAQRAIADYLDRETVRLDALVVAKERVLGLLAEKRRALITRAVTRGLDPNVPLRDSGIPGSARFRRIGRLNARDGCSGSAMNAPTRERRNSSLCRTSLA